MKQASDEAADGASVPMPSKRGGQKKAALAAKETKEAEKSKDEYNHPTLGRLWVTQATQQAYIQYKAEGRKVMLVGVTQSQIQSSNADLHHNQMIVSLAKIAAEHGLDKPNIVSYRDSWLLCGKPPF